MASRVSYAVSCTPIVTIDATTESPAVDALCVDVAKSLGSSGQVTCTWGLTAGYIAGVAQYASSGTASATYAAGQTATALTTVATPRFVYIRHTGYLYSSATVLGAATTLKLKVCLNATIAAATTIAVLNPGEAIVLPFNDTVTSPTFCVAPETNANAIAIEVMATP